MERYLPLERANVKGFCCFSLLLYVFLIALCCPSIACCSCCLVLLMYSQGAAAFAFSCIFTYMFCVVWVLVSYIYDIVLVLVYLDMFYLHDYVNVTPPPPIFSYAGDFVFCFCLRLCSYFWKYPGDIYMYTTIYIMIDNTCIDALLVRVTVTC